MDSRLFRNYLRWLVVNSIYFSKLIAAVFPPAQEQQIDKTPALIEELTLLMKCIWSAAPGIRLKFYESS